MPIPTSAERAQFIAALRDLAGYLADHPEVPVPDTGRKILVFAPAGSDGEERSYVDQAAAALGVTVTEGGGHYRATRDFGPLAYTVVTISAAARARHDAQMSYCDNITAA